MPYVVHEYSETDAEATASDLLNLGTSSVQTIADDVDSRLNTLEAAPPVFTPLALAAGWAQEGDDVAFAYRLTRARVEHTGALLRRTGSSLAVSPGNFYTVATLPLGYRPAADIVMAGTCGVAGNLGAALWLISSLGAIAFSPLVAGGTIATSTGGVGNHVAFGPAGFPVA